MRYSTTQQGPTSATASFFGPPIDTRAAVQISVQLSASAAITGSAQLQFTNDWVKGIYPQAWSGTLVNWSNVSATLIPMSGSGVYLIPVTNISYNAARLNFSGTAGSSGSLYANFKTNGY